MELGVAVRVTAWIVRDAEVLLGDRDVVQRPPRRRGISSVSTPA